MSRLMKDSGIPWIGSIPFDWQTVKMKQVADFQPRCDVSGLSADSEITYTPMECIRNGYFVNNTALYGDLPPSLTPYNNGDIVFAKVTPCFENGNIAIMENLNSGFGLGSSELFVVRPREIGTRFLFYWLQNDAFIQQGRATMTGTGGLKRVSPYFVKNCPLPLPSDKEQQSIANFLDAECARIDAIIEQTRATVEEYKKLKQSIITQAVTKGIRPNRPMKDSGIEWIGGMPNDWLLTKVKYVSSLVTDGAHVSPETENGVYDFVSTVNIDGNKIDFDNCLKTSISSYNYLVSTGCKPQIGDVLISKDGTVGKTVIVNEERDFVVASSLVIIRPKQEMISSEYLNYFLQSKTVQDTLLLLIHGAGLKRVSVAKNANLTLLLPDKEEQHEIVNYLNDKCKAIDLLILKKEQYLLELDSLKKALIFEYVTGKKEAPL
ncbi:MAG: restriction endonuclease subunit S [Thermoguttaceae bacterium]